jgi:hypothetical protein
MNPTVTLTSAEWTIALVVAGIRQCANEAVKRVDAHGASPEDGLILHQQGAAAEAAVAKYLGRWWSGAINDLKAADVGNLQVRSTPYQEGSLILHKVKDADDDCFILAVGTAPTFRLAGWIRGRDGKSERFWTEKKNNGRPAYFVPQEALKPMPCR